MFINEDDKANDWPASSGWHLISTSANQTTAANASTQFGDLWQIQKRPGHPTSHLQLACLHTRGHFINDNNYDAFPTLPEIVRYMTCKWICLLIERFAPSAQKINDTKCRSRGGSKERKGGTRPLSQRFAPYWPLNEIFSECNWSSGMKIYWLGYMLVIC